MIMLRCMRTTLSLDDDVAVDLQRLQRSSGDSWKGVVNRALRAGVATLETEAHGARRTRRTKGVRLGRPRIDIVDVQEALSLAEGDDRA